MIIVKRSDCGSQMSEQGSIILLVGNTEQS